MYVVCTSINSLKSLYITCPNACHWIMTSVVLIFGKPSDDPARMTLDYRHNRV